MNQLWNTFEQDREELDRQYIKAWHHKACYDRVDRLKNEVLSLVDSPEGQPIAIIKAKCFAYILDHAPIYINPIDWFGIALEAQKLEKLEDVGCRPERILIDLNNSQKKLLKNKLHY
jgi:hypothetical protein